MTGTTVGATADPAFNQLIAGGRELRVAGRVTPCAPRSDYMKRLAEDCQSYQADRSAKAAKAMNAPSPRLI